MTATPRPDAIRRFLDEDAGQDIVEYALLAALIGIAAIVTWQVIAGLVGVAYGEADTDIQSLWVPEDPQ